MKRIHKVLCLVNPDANSEAALIQAMKIASDHQAEVTLASVIGAPGTWRALFHSKEDIDRDLLVATQRKRKAIEDWAANHHSNINTNIEIYTGIGFIEVIQSVINNQYDLVVKCAENVDWLNHLFGSDDMHILRKCPCPVLMLKPGQTKDFKSVLATVDVSDNSSEQYAGRVQDQLNRKVLEYGTIFSISELTEMHIGSAWEAYGEDFLRYGAFSGMPDEEVDGYTEKTHKDYSKKLKSLVTEMDEIAGKDLIDFIKPQIHLVKGHPSKELPSMADKYNVDLIVMGTVARVGVPGLIIGNTAESVFGQVNCSVLAIKPDGFESPVVLK